MANATQGGYDAHASEQDSVNPANFAHLIGAGISLGVLLILIGWGANTLMRDASGVPVVEALDGPIRVAPDDPGGVQTAGQGLSVNAIQENTTAAVAADLRLAPLPTELSDDDQTLAVMSAQSPQARPQVATSSLPTAGTVAVESDSVATLAAAMNITPPSDLTRTATPEPALAVQAAPSQRLTQVTAVIRPQARPAALVQASAPQPAATASPFDVAVASGTQLAQLGAFDSRDVAESEWQRISAKFEPYMGGKSPVIQTTVRGDATLFRLRVTGFDGAADARRFCGALSDAGGACFPVVMR